MTLLCSPAEAFIYVPLPVPRTDTAPALLTPTTATVDLGAVRHNARLMQRRAVSADLMAVVKADAYGHGAPQVVRALRAEGVRHFAVARVTEAVALREAGLDDITIQVFEAPLPAYLPAYARYRLGVTVSSEAVAEAIVAEAARHAGSGPPLRAHVKVETGMERVGEAPEVAVRLVERLREAPGVHVAGLWTHFVAADDLDQEDFTRRQLRILQETAASVGPLEHGRVHIANTPGTLNFPESIEAFAPTFVRCGLSLYGLTDVPPQVAEALGEAGRPAQLRPAMRLASKITHLKIIEAGTTVSYDRSWTAPERVRLATVGCGYGDGYARLLSGRAEVGIRGRRFPVVGNICMDLMMVDLGPPDEAPDVAIGEDVVLFGEGGPSAQAVADWSETIPYEVPTRVNKRVPRRYVGEASSRNGHAAAPARAPVAQNGHAPR